MTILFELSDQVWQASCGGLLRAAGALQTRCGAALRHQPELSDTVQQCVEVAAALAGGQPGNGLAAMAPAFGHLDGRTLTQALPDPWEAMRGSWRAACPQENAFGKKLDAQQLKREADALFSRLEAPVRARDYNTLEAVCEETLSFLPLKPGDARDGDLSLYDHGRMTAALASCFVLLAEEKGALLQRDELLQGENLLLFSCDFSGIQSFIYIISTKAALRMLRSRSFYLELVMEHLIDELLEACGLTHANCIYAGGGHAYVLLPNTEKSRQTVKAFRQGVNGWLRDQFGVLLYLACGAQPCSANALFGHVGQEAYSNVFRALSAQLGHDKLVRCDAAALRQLNSRPAGGRECSICGRSVKSAGKAAADKAEERCSFCERFARLGGLLTDPDIVFAIAERELPGNAVYLPLPGPFGPRYVSLLTKNKAEATSETLRWYSKNVKASSPGCRTLWMGDFCPEAMFEKLSDATDGIERLGVFRADVDNLGKAFIAGFSGGKNGESYVSLARASAFSHSMSLFFKRYINEILAKSSGSDGVLVVYSGGDDLFLVGGWSQLLTVTQELSDAFAAYSGGALTFSGGFGLYGDHYPLAFAAKETAELEDFAKKREGKNAITLFAAQEDLRFDWQTFQQKVMGEKYKVLDDFFTADEAKALDGKENERGNTFLYRLLELLRGASKHINIARCAYLLTRLEPSSTARKEVKESYKKFSENFYAWAKQPVDRQQLIAAIYLYVYLHRKKQNET